jgi:F-type H+-transporting ATPase subunit delta
MAHDDVTDGYAEALFAVARAEGALPAVEEELYAFAKTLERDTPLREALTDAALPTENKQALIDDILGDRANPLTVSLLGFVVDTGRARDVSKIVERLVEMAASERDHVVGEVRSAVELTSAQRERIAAALSAATGRTVEVKVVVDPAVVGGVVARVGDEVFDGTVASRLEDAKQRLGSV